MSNYVYPNFSGGGGGGVSSVTASAPLASSGGATPDISYVGPFTAPIEIDQSGLLGANLILNQTGYGGGYWIVKSSGAADPAGAGAFAVQSYTDGTTPFVITPITNQFGLKQVSPIAPIQYSNNIYSGDTYNGGGGWDSNRVAQVMTDGTVRCSWQSQSSFGSNFGTETNHSLRFFTNNADRMFISAAGLIGTNTTTPGRLQHILNTSAQVDNLPLDQTNTVENLLIDTKKATDNGIRINAGTGHVPFIRWSTNASSTPVWEQQAGANNYLIYRFGSSASFSIDQATGWVGINTPTAISELTVAGVQTFIPHAETYCTIWLS